MATKKSNADHLRELISSDSYSKEEALEFIVSMEEELYDAEQELRDNKDTIAELETDNDALVEDARGFSKVFLGLDTLTYRLEQGNLLVTQQLEAWISDIKQQNSATITR